MSDSRRVNGPRKAYRGRIPLAQPTGSTDHFAPVFKFQHAVGNGPYSLGGCGGGANFEALIGCFKKMEQRTWQQIKATGGGQDKTGLGFTILDPGQLPDQGSILDEDVRDRVFEVRVTQTARFMAFRDGNACNIVWYDPNHNISGS